MSVGLGVPEHRSAFALPPEEGQGPSPPGSTHSRVLTDPQRRLRPSPGCGEESGAGVPQRFCNPANPTRGLPFKVKLCHCDPGVPFCNRHLLLLMFPPVQTLHQRWSAGARDAEPEAGARGASEAGSANPEPVAVKGLKSEGLD